jgi:DNA-binding LytR/AlgR family response regulator
MSRPTAIIAEDEARLRDALRETLAEVWPELVIEAEARDGAEACEALERHVPDVLFLDIQMPGMTGLDVAKRASGRCHLVFVTAYDEYAVTAFEQAAVDYVMKPFTTERLAETVRRLKARTRERTEPAELDRVLEALAARLAPAREYLRWIAVSENEETRFITIDEVCYFQSDNKYTRVVTAEKGALIRRTIKELSEEIDPKAFWQIHRSTLVSVKSIAGVMRDFRGQLHVRLKQRKETLPVSEPYLHLFRQM